MGARREFFGPVKNIIARKPRAGFRHLDHNLKHSIRPTGRGCGLHQSHTDIAGIACLFHSLKETQLFDIAHAIS
jgi:hypothetical protein